MKKRLLSLMAVLFIGSALSFVQAQTHARESPIVGSYEENNTAIFMGTGFHFAKGEFAWRQQIQYGTYLTKHFSWLAGVGYDMFRVKVATLSTDTNDNPTMKFKTRTVSVPLTLRYGFGDDFQFVQLHAGASYNYILSERLGGEKLDLTGVKRGYFAAHARVSVIGLIFFEYDYMFNGGGGILYGGVCFDI